MIDRRHSQEATQRYVRSVARAITQGDRDVADDLEQDVLLAALMKGHSDLATKRPWLRSVAVNTLKFARYRSVTRHQHSTNSGIDLTGVHGRELDPARGNSRAEISQRVQKMLEALPDTHRAVVILRAIDGLPPRKVARELGIPVETVRTRYRRGLVLLKESAEREFGDEALAEWHSPAWFVGLWFRRALWGTIGAVAAVVAGVSVLYAWGTRVNLPQVSDVVPFEQLAAAKDAAPVLVPLQVTARAALAPELARVNIEVIDELGMPKHDQDLWLTSGNEEVVLGRTDEIGGLQLADLKPGNWTVWHSGKKLASRRLGSGDNHWELVFETRRLIDVRVANRLNQPSPEIEVYRFHEETTEVELLGRTDAGGRLRVETQIAGSWIAARGLAGISSDAASLDQPIVEGNDGVVKLLLKEHDVNWREVRFPKETAPNSMNVVARSFTQAALTRSVIGKGVVQSSSWLPPWQREDGAFGVRDYPGLVFIAFDANGETWWISERHRQKAPLGPILYPEPPFTVTGQLVDSAGGPLAGMQVGVVGGAGPSRAIHRSMTDQNGRFEVTPCPGDKVRLRAEVGKLISAARPEQGLVTDLGTLQRNRTTLRLEVDGATGPFSTTAYRAAIRRALPELHPSLSGATIRVHGHSDTKECEIDIPTKGFSRHVLIESGAGVDARAAFVQRPEPSDHAEFLRVDLSEAHPVRLQARFPQDRFPVRAVWFEEDMIWTSPALADPATGVIKSVPLSAGRWTLKLVDRMGASTESATVLVAAGKDHDFSDLIPGSGRARIALPSLGLGVVGRGGWLRVMGSSGKIHAAVPIAPGVTRPLSLEVELPAEEHRFVLKLNGEAPAVGRGTIQAGSLVHIPMSTDHVFVGLASAAAMRDKAMGVSLALVDTNGRELWKRPLDPGQPVAPELNWFLVPKVLGARLRTENSDRTALVNLMEVDDISGLEWLTFEEWSGRTE